MIYDAAGRSLSFPGEGKIDAARRPTRVLPHCQGSSAHAVNGKNKMKIKYFLFPFTLLQKLPGT
jgi:hypothetical protein